MCEGRLFVQRTLMMRTVITVITLALALLPSQLRADPTIPGQIPIAELTDNTVFIDVTDAAGQSRGDPGSGVLLAPNGFILTARHIIEPNIKAQTDKIVVALKTPRGQRLPARLFDCTHGEFDACLLYVPSLDIAAAGITKSFPLSCRIPRVTEPVNVSGYPIDSSLVVVSGSVSSSDYGAHNKLYMDARVLPGMSGGPVLDRDGAIVGIIYGYAKDVPLGMFTPLVQAANLLQTTGIPCATDVPKTTISSVDNGRVTHDDNPLPVNPPLPLPSKVFIQISTNLQRTFAAAAFAKLKAAGIPVESGVENVGAKAPPSPQIRYFSHSDDDAARAVRKAIGQDGSKFDLVRLAVRSPPPGLVEVWYPRCDSVGPFCPTAPVQVTSELVSVESGGTTDNRSDQCKDHSALVCVSPTQSAAKLITGTAKFVITERSGGVFIDGTPINADPIGTSNIGWFLKADKNSPTQICATAYARTSACETRVYLRGRLEAQEIKEH
jgi:hypothetical protein